MKIQRQQRIKRLLAAIPELTNYRLQLVDKIVWIFQQPKEFVRDPASTLISQEILEDFPFQGGKRPLGNDG